MLQEVSQTRLEVDSVLGNAVASSCVRAEQWMGAVALLGFTARAGLRCDAVGLGTGLAALTAALAREQAAVSEETSAGGLWCAALHQLAVAGCLGVELGVILWNSATAACNRAQRWHAAIELLLAMRFAQLLPDAVTLGVASGIPAPDWNAASALKLLGQGSQGLQTDVVALGTSLNNCKVAWGAEPGGRSRCRGPRFKHRGGQLLAECLREKQGVAAIPAAGRVLRAFWVGGQRGHLHHQHPRLREGVTVGASARFLDWV